jgi:hypothetical protein
MKARKLKKGERCCLHLRYVGVCVWQDKKRGTVVSTYHKDEMCSKESRDRTYRCV